MITHVAIRFQGKIWHLPAPNRHHHVIGLICREANVSHVDVHGEDQGFLDDALPHEDHPELPGRYLNRHQAELRAYIYGQLKDGKIRGGILTSEDLW